MKKKRKRSRLDHPETIDAILARAGEDRFAQKQPPISIVVWRAAVGARIADQAIPISLERGTLVVRVRSSTWASELSMLSDMILARLHHHELDVRRLVFRTGRLELPQRPIERRETRTVPAPVPLPAIVRREVEGVADDELREAIASAASRALATFNESQRAARGPRSAETESARPDRTDRADPEAATRNRGGGRGRSR